MIVPAYVDTSPVGRASRLRPPFAGGLEVDFVAPAGTAEEAVATFVGFASGATDTVVRQAWVNRRVNRQIAACLFITIFTRQSEPATL